MRVAISQSNYIPWRGYFDLIHDVDLFVFYDDVQFTTRDWRNRNRIKTPQGLLWLTIPVGSSTHRRISDVQITQHDWQRKHRETLRRCYARAPHYSDVEPFFDAVYTRREWTNLSELNQYTITRIAREYLGISTEFRNASEFVVSGRKQDRILELLHAIGAASYHSGPAAKAYLDPERFQKAGIELVWKDYSGYPEYAQLHPPFEHSVSVLDLLVHTGPGASMYVWGHRSRTV